MSTIAVIITAALVVSLAVTVLGFYALAAFIVHKTGGTKGIADIGGAAAAIVAAVLNPSRRR